MKKFIVTVVGFVIFMAALTFILRLISEPNTIANLLGVALLTGLVIISTQYVKFINKKRND